MYYEFWIHYNFILLIALLDGSDAYCWLYCITFYAAPPLYSANIFKHNYGLLETALIWMPTALSQRFLSFEIEPYSVVIKSNRYCLSYTRNGEHVHFKKPFNTAIEPLETMRPFYSVTTQIPFSKSHCRDCLFVRCECSFWRFL